MKLLHSDNYIPANPMQTPASIKAFVIIFFYSLFSLLTFHVKYSAYLKERVYVHSNANNSDITGKVLINGSLISMTKNEIIVLLDKSAKEPITFNK